jgi:hypothetical protein
MTPHCITNIIEQLNLYKNTHPNLVYCWTTYLELKKKNYEYIQQYKNDDKNDDNIDDKNEDNIDDKNDDKNEYVNVLNYIKNGKKDYTMEDIVRILMFKTSLLDDNLLEIM